MREKSNTYRILFGKSEGKTSPGTPRHTLEYNTKMPLREIDWGGMD
jgi:hypothetical protein